MRQNPFSAFELAQRFVGVREVAGTQSNPLVLAMLQLDAGEAIANDEVPWCSAFVNFIAWQLRLPRSKSLAARSWLSVGEPLELIEAETGFDVVIFKRGSGAQPGPGVIAAPGHVAFYAGNGPGVIFALGGNQGDAVNVARFSIDDLLGVRRLA